MGRYAVPPSSDIGRPAISDTTASAGSTTEPDAVNAYREPHSARMESRTPLCRSVDSLCCESASQIIEAAYRLSMDESG